MPAYSAGAARAFDYNAASGTTANFTPAGSNLAAIATVGLIEFGSKTINECLIGVTELDRIGSDHSWNSGNSLMAAFQAAGIAAAETNFSSGWAANPLQSVIVGAVYNDCDQTDPFDEVTPNGGIAFSTDDEVATVSIPGCTVGQRIFTILHANHDNVGLAPFEEVDGTIRNQSTYGTYLGGVLVDKIAATENETIQVRILASSLGTLSWGWRAWRVNAAAGGSTPTLVDALVGGATGAGSAANLNLQTRVAGTVGTAPSAGLQASVRLPVRVNAVAGTATGAGASAALRLQTRVNVAVGTVSAAGSAATVRLDGIIQATAGGAIGNGLQATVLAPTLVVANVGGASAAGAAATVRTGTTISGSVGVASAAGSTATLVLPVRVNATPGGATGAGAPARLNLQTLVGAQRGAATGVGRQAQVGTGGGASAESVWSYLLAGGASAGDVLDRLNTLVDEIHQLHGLRAGQPLVVAQTSRRTGAIEQSVSEADGTVTVERV